MRIDTIRLNPSLEQAAPKTQGDGQDFGNMLMDALKQVNSSQANAANLKDQFLAGQSGVEIHDVMIASETASLALQLTMQVRNKALEAYQELSRMQV